MTDFNPDNEAGALAIAEYVLACIKPVLEGGLGISDRIIGWYLIDEPDISTRYRWALPDRLAKLRFIVRSAEQLARQTWEPGYAALSEAEQLSLLRPCILTMTVPFVLESPGGPLPPRRPAEYRDAEYAGSVGAADIFGFDWYPVMRTNDQIAEDYSGVCTGGGPPRITAPSFTTVDPVRSLRALRQLRTELNGDLLPGDPGYVSIFHWQQTDRFPFHPEEAAEEASPDKSPAFLAPPTLGSCQFEPSGRRFKLYPLLHLLRFYNWGGGLEFSEGTFGFNQFLSPDIRLKEDFSRVAAEMEYFAAARYSQRNRLHEIVTQSLTYGPVGADTRDFMAPAVLYFDYELAPATPITGPHKKWLIIVNRDFRQLTAQFTFVENGQRFQFQRVEYLVPVGPRSQPIIPDSRTTERFTVPAYGVLILPRINIP